MNISELIARTDHKLRPALNRLPNWLYYKIYSSGRKIFLGAFARNNFHSEEKIPPALIQTLWGIKFGAPVFNAAGMFKKGEAYQACATLGAGAYLAGTTTYTPRKGNRKALVKHPFTPLPSSGAAINWMGMPNLGHAYTAKILSQIEKREFCPVGASISPSPREKGAETLKGVVVGLKLYERANADFIELNESCPNVPHISDIDKDTGLDKHLINRLEYCSKRFLKIRKRNIPIIVKFSNDTLEMHIPPLIDILSDLGYGGANFGNTSIDYLYFSKFIGQKEFNKFSHFTKEFGGGISGRPLKERSLSLASKAAGYVKNKNMPGEFHIIRTGGVETAGDISQSKNAGIALNQWFTGFFDAFARHGAGAYRNIYKELAGMPGAGH